MSDVRANILEARQLQKRYGNVVAVDGIDLAIAEGICFGLLGPNGAGKTTTIEMLEGILDPTGGSILYRGAPRSPDFLQQIGIQFQSTALMDFITVRETLQLFSRFYDTVEPIDHLVEQCDLGDFLDRYANKLSGGQQQRLLLALALLNRPQLVFLDEPTTGLDPQARRNFWRLIDDVKQRGTTVILTTHYMDEAEQLCDELAIMDRGRIIARGSPAALLAEHFGYLFVCLDRHDSEAALPLFTAEDTVYDGDRVYFRTRSVEQALQQLMAARVPLDSLSVHNPTLEDLFLKLTGQRLRD